jgi:hypothetical protein
VADAEVLGEQPVLSLDHVVVVVARKPHPQSVARLARAAVPDPVRQDHVPAGGIERRARAVQLVGERLRHELASGPAGAVNDQDAVRYLASSVALRAAEREVVNPELGELFAGAEGEVLENEVAFGGAGGCGRREKEPTANHALGPGFHAGHLSRPLTRFR